MTIMITAGLCLLFRSFAYTSFFCKDKLAAASFLDHFDAWEITCSLCYNLTSIYVYCSFWDYFNLGYNYKKTYEIPKGLQESCDDYKGRGGTLAVSS